MILQVREKRGQHKTLLVTNAQNQNWQNLYLILGTTPWKSFSGTPTAVPVSSSHIVDSDQSDQKQDQRSILMLIIKGQGGLIQEILRYNYVAKLDLPFQKTQSQLLTSQKMQLVENNFQCLRLI